MLAKGVVRDAPQMPESHRAYYRRFSNGDDGLLLYFSQGGSYTGDETVEISLHGSQYSVTSLIESLIKLGARLAEPGEFTRRAFMNGRIDLTSAEAVQEVIDSVTETQFRAASEMVHGSLRREVESLRKEATRLIAEIEARVDFEEEVGPLDRDTFAADLERLFSETSRLASTANSGRLLRNGFRIAILGQPNAGKSSLLNRLVQHERALVSSTAGTTRDYITESVDIGGVACILVDTAGLRSTTEDVEARGVALAIDQAKIADAIWYIYDSSLGWTDDDEAAATLVAPTLVIANKSDLGQPRCEEHVSLSAHTGEGVEVLIDWVKGQIPSVEFYCNERHAGLLEDALASLRSCLEAFTHHMPDDFLVTCLRDTVTKFDSILGLDISADALDDLFSHFCIGK